MRIDLFKKALKTAVLVAPLALLPLACGEGDSDEEEELVGGADGTGVASQSITMTGTLNLTGAFLAV